MSGAIRQLRRRVSIWIGLAVALGLVAGAVPLFGVLGYELALAASVFAAICGLDLGAAFARERSRMPARSAYAGRTLAGSTLVACALAVTIVAVPAIVCGARGIWVPTCDWWFGIEAYVAMPLATAALAGALGHSIGIVVGPGGWSRSVLGVALPLIVLAGGALWRFYAESPVFVYSPIIGYFPGNLYDENLHLGAPLAWARLEQLLWVVAIASAVATRFDVPTFRVRLREPRPAGRRIAAWLVAIACAAGAVALHHEGGALGYAVDTADLETILDGRIETAHFVIHYARTPEIERDLELIARDHEFRYAEVVGQLGVAPAGKLRSFYFADPDQKARWFGARNVEMAKPWLHAIYLDHRPFPHGSLRHEIAHAVAAATGDPIFGVAVRDVVLFDPGLIEGLAVALDWPGNDEAALTPHESVRALQLMGLAPTIGELFSVRFLAVASSRGYTTAGSFIRFLLDRYGAAPLRAVYRNGGDFAAAYHQPLASLEAEWRTMIAAIELPPEIVEGTRELFRTGSVFSRPCPHAIAADHDHAAAALAAGDRPRAIKLLRQICGDAPEEPRNRLELGELLAVGTDGERAEALALWNAIADAPTVTSTLRARALERLAAAAATAGDLTSTIALVERARTLPVDPGQRRQLDAETFALRHPGPASGALRGYFFVHAIDAPVWAELAVLAEPDLGFGHYILGLQHANAGAWRASAEELDLALTRGLPGIAFVRNAARKLALVAYRADDTQRVGRAIATLEGAGTTQTDRLLAADWRRRLAFDATGRP